MDELESRAAPKFTALSEEIKQLRTELVKNQETTQVLIAGLCEQLEQTNVLLDCIKQGHKAHRGWKSNVTFITLGFAVIVWAVEFFTGVPVLSKVMPFLKGLIL